MLERKMHTNSEVGVGLRSIDVEQASMQEAADKEINIKLELPDEYQGSSDAVGKLRRSLYGPF